MSAELKLSWPIFNGYAPAVSPRIMYYQVDFDASRVTPQTVDLFKEEGLSAQMKPGVQSMFIDNSALLVPTTITFFPTQVPIICPPGAQGVFPVFCGDQTIFTVANATGGTFSVKIWLCNFPQPYGVWKIA